MILSETHCVSRRDIMKALVAGASALGALSPLSALAQSASQEDIQGLLTQPEAGFLFARILYQGGDWNTDMLHQGLKGGSEINLLKRVLAETTIQAQAREAVVQLADPLLFTAPFLYITGHGRILMTDVEVKNLGRALEAGAFLFGDACNGKGPGFDDQFRAVLRRALPTQHLQRLPMSHPLFHCFYNIGKIQGGDKFLDPFIEGIEIEGRLAVLHTVNDLGCAWEGHPCRPGGEEQRDHAFRLGVNMIVYALTH